MSHNINLNLTKELREFIDSQSGEGTLYATPSEFMRDLLREKKRRLDAAAVRDAILEGSHDLIEQRSIEFNGSWDDAIKKAKKRDQEGWK